MRFDARFAAGRRRSRPEIALGGARGRAGRGRWRPGPGPRPGSRPGSTGPTPCPPTIPPDAARPAPERRSTPLLAGGPDRYARAPRRLGPGARHVRRRGRRGRLPRRAARRPGRRRSSPRAAAAVGARAHPLGADPAAAAAGLPTATSSPRLAEAARGRAPRPHAGSDAAPAAGRDGRRRCAARATPRPAPSPAGNPALARAARAARDAGARRRADRRRHRPRPRRRWTEPPASARTAVPRLVAIADRGAARRERPRPRAPPRTRLGNLGDSRLAFTAEPTPGAPRPARRGAPRPRSNVLAFEARRRLRRRSASRPPVRLAVRWRSTSKAAPASWPMPADAYAQRPARGRSRLAPRRRRRAGRRRGACAFDGRRRPRRLAADLHRRALAATAAVDARA